MDVVDFLQCQKQCLSLLNAGPDDFSFSVNVGDEQFGTLGAASDQVKEALLAFDADVYNAIAETEGHWARPFLMAWSGQLDHLDEVPDHVGSTGDVQILPAVGVSYIAGEPATVAEIREWRRAANNAFGSLPHNSNNSGNGLAGFFEIRDNVVHFTGYKLEVKIISPYVRNAAACQSPAIYQLAVWAGALSVLFAKVNMAKASFMAAQYARINNQIRGNLQVAPILEQYKEAKG